MRRIDNDEYPDRENSEIEEESAVEDYKNVDRKDGTGFSDESSSFFLVVAVFLTLVEVAIFITAFAFSPHIPSGSLMVGLTMNAKAGFYFKKTYADGAHVFISAILCSVAFLSIILKVWSMITVYFGGNGVITLLGPRGLHVCVLIGNSFVFAVTMVLILPASGLGYIEHAFTGVVMVCACSMLFCAALAKRIEPVDGFSLKIAFSKYISLVIGCAFFLYPIIVAYTSKNTIHVALLDFHSLGFWLSLPNIVLIFHVAFLVPSILNALPIDRRVFTWSAFETYHMLHTTLYLATITGMVIYGSIATSTFDQSGQFKEMIQKTLVP